MRAAVLRTRSATNAQSSSRNRLATGAPHRALDADPELARGRNDLSGEGFVDFDVVDVFLNYAAIWHIAMAVSGTMFASLSSWCTSIR